MRGIRLPGQLRTVITNSIYSALVSATEIGVAVDRAARRSGGHMNPMTFRRLVKPVRKTDQYKYR
jgi:hypothetical protein